MDIDQKHPYHSISIEETLKKVSGSKDGLSSEEAKKRQEQFGKNKLPEKGGTNLLMLFLKQFKDFLILILFIAAGVAYWADQMADVYIILAVILFNAVMGFTQEYKAEKAIQSIKSIVKKKAFVLRDGKEEEMSAEEVVPGDIILLKEGSAVPADARLLERKDLRATEASLTGESMPVEKKTEPVEEDAAVGDRWNMVWKGTNVARGRGKAVVTAIGKQTEIGKIATSMSEMKLQDSNFKKKTRKLGKQMAFIALTTAFLVFAIGYWYRDFVFQDILLVTIATLVSSIPEGLPVVISIVLAIGANRMAKKNAIIREFTATEMMGSVSTILSDKTGTITQSILTVKRTFTGSAQELNITGSGYQLDGKFKKENETIDLEKYPVENKLFAIAAFCNSAHIKGEEKEKPQEIPDKESKSEEKEEKRKQKEEIKEESAPAKEDEEKDNNGKQGEKEVSKKATKPAENKPAREDKKQKDKEDAQIKAGKDSVNEEKAITEGNKGDAEKKGSKRDIDVDLDVKPDKVKISVSIDNGEKGSPDKNKEDQKATEKEEYSREKKSGKNISTEDDKDLDIDLDVKKDRVKTNINIKSRKKDNEEPGIEEEEEEEEEIEEEEEDNEIQVSGDPTEVAMLILGRKAKVKQKEPYSQYQLLDDLPFNSDQKFRASLVKTDNDPEIFVIGAPERILELSSHWLSSNGMQEMTAEKREEIRGKTDQWTGEAMRVLCQAFKNADNKESVEADDVKDLIWVGITGIIDPPRKGVKEAVQECKTAGVRVMMVTGDHKRTAAAIAEQVGIVESKEQREEDNFPVALTSKELDVDDDKFDHLLEHVNVYARVDPQTKLRIAERLQAKDYLIAMTGDGVNDAPALKRADVGIAMGQRGTDVAKDASQIVLQDDNFSSIVNAIREGRIVFENVKKTSYFLLTTNFASTAVLIIGLLLGFPIPLTAAMILYINLVTDGVMDIALATETGHGEMMHQPPVKKGADILHWDIAPYLLLMATIMVSLSILVLNYYFPQGIEIGRTGTFLTVAMTQLFNVFNMRSLRKSIFEIGMFTNKWINIAFFASLAGQIAVIKIPFLRDLFGFENLPVLHFLVIFALSSLVLWGGELFKYLKFKKNLF